MTGNEYADLIAEYILRRFGDRSLDVFREVTLGKTIIGKNRRLDILVIERSTKAALAIECKYQDSQGTVDEKIPYALEDMASMPMPTAVVYAGKGFSPGIAHMLAASPISAFCWPGGNNLSSSKDTREFDAILAMTFKWWDVVLLDKVPLTIK